MSLRSRAAFTDVADSVVRSRPAAVSAAAAARVAAG